jgi:cytochrome c oxidase assembly protein subunit 11
LLDKNTRLVPKLLVLVVGMFGFGFALVPIYSVFCKVTGLGGKTGGVYAYDASAVQPDPSRYVEVSFITDDSAGMPWEFRAETSLVRVHPGELTEVKFYARNPTDHVMVGQAIPSVVPLPAAAHFHKTECFCFSRQVLQPGQEIEMPMRFFLAPELPRSVDSISLSYSMYDVTALAAADVKRPNT